LVCVCLVSIIGKNVIFSDKKEINTTTENPNNKQQPNDTHLSSNTTTLTQKQTHKNRKNHDSTKRVQIQNTETEDETDNRHSIALILVLIPLSTLCTNLLIILLKRSQILPGLRELPFLHALTHVPVHKGPLRIHQVKLVVNPREHLSNTGRVRYHAHGPLHLCQVTTRDHSWWLVVDAALESSRAPVDKLNGAFGFDSGHSCINILWDHITSVHEAASHVLSMSWVTFHHHGRRLKGSVGLLSRDYRSIRREHEVNSRVRDKVRLELVHVHIQGAVHKHCTRNVFSSTSFAEESVEGIITATNCGITGHLSIRL
ncbi:P-loop containing nucleoside triphosphatehydrolases superfamily protein, partial [Striga asiatica]